nr:hypothetical protein [Tanacetum cinerariifolium]
MSLPVATSILSLLSSSPLAREIEFTFLVTGSLASSLINTFLGVLLVVSSLSSPNIPVILSLIFSCCLKMAFLNLSILLDIIVKFYGPSRWKELSKETSSKILPCGDGSCWKTFKPIASLIVNGKLK